MHVYLPNCDNLRYCRSSKVLMCVFLVQSDLWTFAKYLDLLKLFEDKLVDSTATMLDTHMHTTSEYAHAQVYHLANIVTSLTEPITCIASSHTATLCKWISNHRLDVCGWQAQLIQLTCHNDPACFHTSGKLS